MRWCTTDQRDQGKKQLYGDSWSAAPVRRSIWRRCRIQPCQRSAGSVGAACAGSSTSSSFDSIRRILRTGRIAEAIGTPDSLSSTPRRVSSRSGSAEDRGVSANCALDSATSRPALAARSTEVAASIRDLAAFRIRYRQEVGLLHDELDELEYAIAEAELGRSPSASRRKAQDTNRTANQSQKQRHDSLRTRYGGCFATSRKPFIRTFLMIPTRATDATR